MIDKNKRLTYLTAPMRRAYECLDDKDIIRKDFEYLNDIAKRYNLQYNARFGTLMVTSFSKERVDGNRDYYIGFDFAPLQYPDVIRAQIIGIIGRRQAKSGNNWGENPFSYDNVGILVPMNVAEHE